MSESALHKHGIGEPSPWVIRWAARVQAGGTVLDVAGGTGRHARYFASRGCTVEVVDRDAAALDGLRGVPCVHTTVADIESGSWPWSDTARTFDAVVVTNYLHRPLFPALLAALAPGGVLIYETFALGNERFGRPSNPAFLLQPGELLELVRGRLHVVAYEDVLLNIPKPAMVQRLCATN